MVVVEDAGVLKPADMASLANRTWIVTRSHLLMYMRFAFYIDSVAWYVYDTDVSLYYTVEYNAKVKHLALAMNIDSELVPFEEALNTNEYVTWDDLAVIIADIPRAHLRELTLQDLPFFWKGNYCQGYDRLINRGLPAPKAQDFMRVMEKIDAIKREIREVLDRPIGFPFEQCTRQICCPYNQGKYLIKQLYE